MCTREERRRVRRGVWPAHAAFFKGELKEGAGSDLIFRQEANPHVRRRRRHTGTGRSEADCTPLLAPLPRCSCSSGMLSHDAQKRAERVHKRS